MMADHNSICYNSIMDVPYNAVGLNEEIHIEMQVPLCVFLSAYLMISHITL